MDEWTIKTPNPVCRLFFQLTCNRICGILFHRFYRLEIHSLMVCIFDSACELLPPWTKELYLCTVAPLLYLLSDLLLSETVALLQNRQRKDETAALLQSWQLKRRDGCSVAPVTPEVELRFCPWIMLFKDWTGWPDLSSALFPYYVYVLRGAA
jgi:hypothetical protein